MVLMKDIYLNPNEHTGIINSSSIFKTVKTL